MFSFLQRVFIPLSAICCCILVDHFSISAPIANLQLQPRILLRRSPDDKLDQSEPTKKLFKALALGAAGYLALSTFIFILSFLLVKRRKRNMKMERDILAGSSVHDQKSLKSNAEGKQKPQKENGKQTGSISTMTARSGREDVLKGPLSTNSKRSAVSRTPTSSTLYFKEDFTQELTSSVRDLADDVVDTAKGTLSSDTSTTSSTTSSSGSTTLSGSSSSGSSSSSSGTNGTSSSSSSSSNSSSTSSGTSASSSSSSLSGIRSRKPTTGRGL